MADGVVLQFVNECPNNNPPLANQFNNTEPHDDNLWTTQMNASWGRYRQRAWGRRRRARGRGQPFLHPAWTRDCALYAHMQKGSLNDKLTKVGAKVKAGDFLGLAGNAGNASEPHLHIHTIKGTQPEIGPLRPLLFRDMWAIDEAALALPVSPDRGRPCRRKGLHSGRTTPSSGRSTGIRSGPGGRIWAGRSMRHRPLRRGAPTAWMCSRPGRMASSITLGGTAPAGTRGRRSEAPSRAAPPPCRGDRTGSTSSFAAPTIISVTCCGTAVRGRAGKISADTSRQRRPSRHGPHIGWTCSPPARTAI